MVELETIEELAESLADMVGVYGCGCSDTDANGFENHSDDCKCRLCFVDRIQSRIREAVKNDQFLQSRDALTEISILLNVAKK